MKKENLTAINIHKLSNRSQYEDALSRNGIDDTALYLVPDWHKITYDITAGKTEVEITPEDKAEYYCPNGTTKVTIKNPTVSEYECWINIESVNGISPSNIVFPSEMICLGSNTSSYTKIKYAEISIKNGKYIVGCYGT